MPKETSNTLLHALQQDVPNADAWERLLQSYEPLIRAILACHGLRGEVANDVTQNVLTVMVQRLPDFQRQRTGSFRCWIRQITVNCLREQWQTSRKHRSQDVQELIAGIEDPNSRLTQVWNRRHARHVVEALLQAVAKEFTPQTMDAFRRLALKEQSVQDVASELGMSTNACFIARSRVLRRLRQRMREVLGDDDELNDLMG